jgi:hypothetical protein
VETTLPVATEALLLCAGSIVVWSLSLYVVSRGGWHPVPTLAAVAMWALVLYELGVGLGAFAPDDATWRLWVRGTWPGPALLPALWLLLTAALAVDEAEAAQRPRWRRLFRIALLVAGPLGLLFAAGAPFDYVRRWDVESLVPAPGAGVGGIGDVPPGLTGRRSLPGTLYPLYVAYVLVCSLWAMANLIVLWRSSAAGTALRARFRWLIIAALLFFTGGTFLAVAAGAQDNVSGLPGHALLLAGMLIVGWSIARYGALLAGEVMTGDAPAFVVSMLALVAVYGLTLAVLLPRDASWPLRALPLVLLALTTHVVVLRRGPLFDRWLYGRVGGALRAQLSALAERVVRQPDPLSALADARETVAALVSGAETEPAAGPASTTETPVGSAAVEVPSVGLRVLVEGAVRASYRPAAAQRAAAQSRPARDARGLAALPCDPGGLRRGASEQADHAALPSQRRHLPPGPPAGDRRARRRPRRAR